MNNKLNKYYGFDDFDYIGFLLIERDMLMMDSGIFNV
jgi:hypothetical protein